MSTKGMGSNRLISLKEAAELLGVKERTIHYHVRKGRLHPRYAKEQGLKAPMQFDRDEVAAVAEIWGEHTSFSGLMSRSTQAYALARSLERRLTLLEELIGAKYTALPTDEASVRSLYLEARDDLQSPPADPQRISYWATIFMSMGEEFFDTLEAYTNNERSWEVMHDLSRAIAEEAPQDLKKFPELVEAYQAFETARRNLRHVLFFHLQSRFGAKSAMKMFAEDISAHERVLRFLSATS